MKPFLRSMSWTLWICLALVALVVLSACGGAVESGDADFSTPFPEPVEYAPPRLHAANACPVCPASMAACMTTATVPTASYLSPGSAMPESQCGCMFEDEHCYRPCKDRQGVNCYYEL